MLDISYILTAMLKFKYALLMRKGKPRVRKEHMISHFNYSSVAALNIMVCTV